MKSLDARLTLLEKAAPPKWTIHVVVQPEGSPPLPERPGVLTVRITPHGDGPAPVTVAAHARPVEPPAPRQNSRRRRPSPRLA